MKYLSSSCIAAILLLFAVVFVISSCSHEDIQSSGNETITVINTTENSAAEVPEPLLPDADYGGETFTFLIISRQSASYPEIYVFTEEQNGEPVNDAVYNRNLAVEEKYNIKIAAIESDNVASKARSFILANDDSCDVFFERRSSTGELAAEGYLVDLLTLDHINLRAPYWDANAADNLRIANKLFFMPNDISLKNLEEARFLYFNKKIIDDYNLGDPYDLVDENNWTFDTFLSMVKSVGKDLNGDGIMDHNDLYGMLTETDSNIMYFVVSSGVEYTKYDADGLPVLSLMNEKTQSVMEKLHDVLFDSNCCISFINLSKTADITGYAHVYNYGRALFAADQFLFVQNGIGVSSQFTDMKSDYGIVPNPKYDSSQEFYKHKIGVNGSAMCIPVTNIDLDRTSVILEYMAYTSGKLLLPAYYDITVKTKRFRDNRAAEMLDLVKGSIYYNIGDSFRSVFTVNIDKLLYDSFANLDFASRYASNSEAIQIKLNEIYEKVILLDS